MRMQTAKSENPPDSRYLSDSATGVFFSPRKDLRQKRGTSTSTATFATAMADILLGTGASSGRAAKRQKKTTVAGISDVLSERLRVETLHLCATTGTLLGAAGPFSHAPCSLLPFPFPAALFHQSIALAEIFNVLIDRVSRDYAWLSSTVRTTVAHDEFTRRQLEILDSVHREGVAQPLQLSINRSDYMVDQPTADATPRLLQVELNTVSVSFVSLAAKMTQVHTASLERLACDVSAASVAQLTSGRAALAGALRGGDSAAVLPPNNSVDKVASALAQAHAEYVRRHAASKPHSPSTSAPTATVVVLMVVQPNERNVVDQRGIEHGLWASHKVALVRRTLPEIHDTGSLGPDGQLLLTASGADGAAVTPLEVSVAYFRAGYTPRDFTGDTEWSARLTLERSIAIKCPSMSQHLAGTKKVQQALSIPSELSRFTNASEASQLSACFARLHGLEATADANGTDGTRKAVEQIVAEAIRKPDGFVLKPQREGGGNNLYGIELKEALQTMGADERASYILMERIRPYSVPMPLMREGELDGGGCTCELGVYGVILADGTRTLCNEAAGHLLRVKLDGVDEGGVCAGFAVLSSPALSE